MSPRDRVQAEAVLRHLFTGATVAGLQFAFAQRRLLLNFFGVAPPVKADWFYLDIETRAALYAERPDRFPTDETTLPELTPERFAAIVGQLHDAEITGVELGDRTPHLVLTFRSGAVLFINGHHELYECWQAGISGGDPSHPWLVVACPGAEVAIWAPGEFVRQHIHP